MDLNNPEQITTYVKAATSALMGVDDVVRAFKDMPRRPAFQSFMNEQLGIKDPTSAYLNEVKNALNPESSNEKENKTEQEKITESMIGEAVQENFDPQVIMQTVPFSQDGQSYKLDMNILQENKINSPDFYRQRGFEPTLDELGNIIGLTGPQNSKFKVTRFGEITPVGTF
tara:strand:+ start:489 stop:1001 length:513 start_codon:yes stop_codon:yes gene_type:complete